MLIECVETQGEYDAIVLPRDIHYPLGENNYCCSSEWFTIDSTTSGFSLTRKKQYLVYGLLNINGRIRYLLKSDEKIPGFFPAELFHAVDLEYGPGWICRRYPLASSILILTTFPELNTYQDIIGIMDINPSFVRKFVEFAEHLAKWLDYDEE